MEFFHWRKAHSILFLIVLLAFSLDACGLWNRELGVDEGLTINVTKSFSSAIDFSNSDFYPPLSYTFMVPFFALLGVFGTRVLFAFIGVLSVALFYFLARGFFGEGKALASTLLFALNPLTVFYSVHLRQYTPLLFLLLLALYSFIALQRRFSWKALAGMLVPCVLMGYIHYASWVYVLALALSAVFFYREKKRFKNIALGLALAFLALALLVPLALSQFSEFTGSQYYPKETLFDPFIYPYAFYKFAVGVNISSALEFFPPLLLAAPLVLSFAAIGLHGFFRSSKPNSRFLLFFFFFSVFLLFLVSLKVPMLFSFRYLFPMMPLFSLFLSKGLFSANGKKAVVSAAAIIALWLAAIFYYCSVVSQPGWNALVGL